MKKKTWIYPQAMLSEMNREQIQKTASILGLSGPEEFYKIYGNFGYEHLSPEKLAEHLKANYPDGRQTPEDWLERMAKRHGDSAPNLESV